MNPAYRAGRLPQGDVELIGGGGQKEVKKMGEAGKVGG